MASFGLLELPPLRYLPYVAVLLVTLYVASKFSYAFFLSPVRHVPGPWWARISRLPLLYATYRRRRTEYATALLHQYGQVVVIAPDQVHTTDEEAMKSIYSRHSLKTPFYANMGSWKGVTSTLGFIDYTHAAPSRNNLLQCFQNKNLDTLVENMSSHIADFTKLLAESASRNDNIDGIVAFRLLALDIVTDVLWGETDRLLTQVGESTPVFLRRFHAFSSWNALKSFIPALDLIVAWFGTTLWRNLRKDCSDMDVTAREALKRWKAKSNHRQKDVLTMLLAFNKEESAEYIPTEHITAYMVEMLAAGSSTTSHTASFVCHLLARNLDAQRKLQEELRAQFPDRNAINEKEMIDLPYLDAVIRETMRMFPMIPGPLERRLVRDVEAAGLLIPAGIVASTAAYSQGRLPDVYPEPNAWKPERWLCADARMKMDWIPFGFGARSCPGANLAMTELKYIIGTIFRLFDTMPPAGHEHEVLELADIFAAGPASGQCLLRFKERDD